MNEFATPSSKIDSRGNINPASAPRVMRINTALGEADFNNQLASFLEVDLSILPENYSTIRASHIGSLHQFEVLANAEQTVSVYSCVRMRHVKGFGPPVHIHRNEDEYFVILDGEYLYQVAEQQFRLQAGDCLYAPAMSLMAFVV